jgi:hypothetical protein
MAAEIDPEYLKHQYLYVPWTDGIDTVSAGKALGLYVAHHHKVHPTVVTITKQNASFHDEFKKLNIVTERSGHVPENSVVIAWCPTRKVMEKVHDRKSIVILVEWPSTRFEAWAKLVGAYNVITREVMNADLNEAGTKALEGIIWEGYNGWHDDIARRLTLARLRELDEAGGYDREIVLQYAAQERSHYGLERLEKILNQFEASRVIA